MAMSERIVSMLTRLAKENPGTKGKFKIAAGVVYKKHLISTGVNSYKTHPLMKQYGKNSDAIYLHAEVDAIKNALRLITQDHLNKCDLYIVRVKRPYDGAKNWIHGLAKPCLGCCRAIETFGIKNVYYTTEA